MKNTDYTLKFDSSINVKELIGGIEFHLVNLSESYRIKWNISPTLDDFGVLMLDGEVINDNLYRIGGLSVFDRDDTYMALLLQVEAHYSKDIMKMSKSNGTSNHLDNQTAFINRNGEIKVVFDNTLNYPYLEGGCIYSLNRKYYNIETNELICSGSGTVKSRDFLFIESRYHLDKTKRGVYQININNGTYVLYPPRD